MSDLTVAINASAEREIGYLRATLELRDTELRDKTAAIGVLTGIAQSFADELTAQGRHSVAAIIRSVVAESQLR